MHTNNDPDKIKAANAEFYEYVKRYTDAYNAKDEYLIKQAVFHFQKYMFDEEEQCILSYNEALNELEDFRIYGNINFLNYEDYRDHVDKHERH